MLDGETSDKVWDHERFFYQRSSFQCSNHALGETKLTCNNHYNDARNNNDNGNTLWNTDLALPLTPDFLIIMGSCRRALSLHELPEAVEGQEGPLRLLEALAQGLPRVSLRESFIRRVKVSVTKMEPGNMEIWDTYGKPMGKSCE